MELRLVELTPRSQLITGIAAVAQQQCGTVSLAAVQDELEETMGVESWGSTPCHLTPILLRCWAGKKYRDVYRHVFVTFSIERITKLNLDLLRRVGQRRGGIFTITPEHFWEAPAAGFDFGDSLACDETLEARASSIIAECEALKNILRAQEGTAHLQNLAEPICGCINCIITCDLATALELIAIRKQQLRPVEGMLQALAAQLAGTAEWLRAIISQGEK
jgi:hypothetical protein